MMSIALYKPTVTFFRLTNSQAMFQVIMNDILRELINTGEIAFFIDDILVGVDMKEGHDEVVEEVLKKEENNLYIKLEKCIWKSRKVNFLKVELELEGVRIEKEKVKRVMDWPML